MTLVSVVVPLFNKENYIHGCISSILHQTFRDFEVIVIDDGSTDNSIEKISLFTDTRVSVIRQNNQGPGAARNKGLSLATGKYVSFLDADDEWHPEFLQTAVTCLSLHVECDLFLCGSTWRPKADVRLPVMEEEVQPASGPWEFPLDASAHQAYRIMDFFALGTVVIKREVPLRYGGFFDGVRCTSGEDAYLWIQVMLNHWIYRELKSLVTINTEGSDLGIGRGELKPIPPSLLYSRQLFQHCPPVRKKTLLALLDYTAFLAVRRELHKYHIWSAWRLYRKFPRLINYKPKDFPPFPSAFWIIPIRKLKKRIFA